jgi:hypothetical protein
LCQSEEEPAPPSTFSIDRALMPSDYGSPQVVEEHKAQLTCKNGRWTRVWTEA